MPNNTSCIEPQNLPDPNRVDSNGNSATHWKKLNYIQLKQQSGNPNAPNQASNHSQGYGLGYEYSGMGVFNTWDEFITDLNNQPGGSQTFNTSMSPNDVTAKIQSAERQHYESIIITISIATGPCNCSPGTSTSTPGGDFNTQTNSCPDGYLYNECTGLCESTEITTTGDVEGCDGMVINPIGNGSFITSGDFVDYFTDFDNGMEDKNIDEYYFESDEPLPWGTFVADQCTGSNGLPIRRVVGFKKDQSILPIDTTLYVNYQTFINQLNVDEHGVDETVNFSDLTSELITGSFEGSCQHKTLITNPLSADGSFPTPGSGNTGMVDFLE